MEKLPNFHQNHGPFGNRLEKSLFLDFFNFLLFRKAFFRERHFFPSLNKNEKMEKLPISDQNHGITP